MPSSFRFQKQLKPEPEMLPHLYQAKLSLWNAIQSLASAHGRSSQMRGLQLIMISLMMEDASADQRPYLDEQLDNNSQTAEQEALALIERAVTHVKAASATCGRRDCKKRLNDAATSLGIMRHRLESDFTGGITEAERQALRLFAARILGGGFPPEKAASLKRAREARARNRLARPKQTLPAAPQGDATL